MRGTKILLHPALCSNLNGVIDISVHIGHCGFARTADTRQRCCKAHFVAIYDTVTRGGVCTHIIGGTIVKQGHWSHKQPCTRSVFRMTTVNSGIRRGAPAYSACRYGIVTMIYHLNGTNCRLVRHICHVFYVSSNHIAETAHRASVTVRIIVPKQLRLVVRQNIVQRKVSVCPCTPEPGGFAEIHIFRPIKASSRIGGKAGAVVASRIVSDVACASAVHPSHRVAQSLGCICGAVAATVSRFISGVGLQGVKFPWAGHMPADWTNALYATGYSVTGSTTIHDGVPFVEIAQRRDQRSIIVGGV